MKRLDKPVKQKGFTLVETIIYVALIGMVVSTFVSFALKVTEIRNKNYVVGEVQANAREVMNFLADKIRESQTVLVPVKGSSSNSLSLQGQGVGNGMVFDLVSGVLYFTPGSMSPDYLNSEETNITNLEFSNFSQDGERDSIKISLTIEFRRNDSYDFRYSKTVETVVSLRL